MALFGGIQECIAFDANNIARVFDAGNIVSISALYPCIPLKTIQYYININVVCVLRQIKDGQVMVRLNFSAKFLNYPR